MKPNRSTRLGAKKHNLDTQHPKQSTSTTTPLTPIKRSLSTSPADIDFFDAPALPGRYVPRLGVKLRTAHLPIATAVTPFFHNNNNNNNTRRPHTTHSSPLTQQQRHMGSPAGDVHPSFKKRHPGINAQYHKEHQAKLAAQSATHTPLLSGPDAIDPMTSAGFGGISSASFGSATITDTSLTVNGTTTTKLPSASMMNVDQDLLQFIDKKSWLPSRQVNDTLPAGLPVAIQNKIRDFQQKLPAPVHTDTAAILALPKQFGGFGFEHLTFIQGRLLPMIASGLDILLRAPTSSGKTLAYAIPLLEKLIYSRQAANSRQIPIIVLVPSRELALQTSATIKHLVSLHRRTESRHFGVFALIGGSSAMRVEQEPLQRTDIGFLVCTTQRLLDHIEHTPGFKERLQECKTVVLDEVDYLLAQTGGKDIGAILEVLHPQRQTIMMSATLTPAVRKVASFALRKGACVVDVVKDSIVSLGTGVAETLSKRGNGDEEVGEDGEPINKTDNRVGKFNSDDHDLLTKRQQELVGHFVDQDGERIHIDHSHVIDNLGTGKLVYENQRFKKLHLEQEAEAERLALAEEQADEAKLAAEAAGYDLVTDVDPVTGVKTLKRVSKKRPLRDHSSYDLDQHDKAQVTFKSSDESLLKQAGFETTTPTSDSDHRYSKLNKLRGGIYGSHPDDANRSESDSAQPGSMADSSSGHSGEHQHRDFRTDNADPSGSQQESNPDLDLISKIKAKLAEKSTTTKLSTTIANTARKLDQDSKLQPDSHQQGPDALDDNHPSFNMEQTVQQARQQLNEADVGPIGALLKQNEDIVDELALYTDDEDDPNLVVFDEINHNVQHFVQAATTRESLDIVSRLFDDIGGRFIYAKEQVKQHNIRIKNDPHFQGAELEAPKPPKIMVFCETARYAQYLTSLFREVIDLNKDNAFEAILEIHSKKGQNFRTRVAQQFSSQNWNAGCILFSSDVAARGLDTQDVDCVIQLGLPPSRQQWIHRVGRVARDGDQLGLSLTIVAPPHAAQFSRMTNGLPINVPKVGALGLGLKQDNFNNSVVDPTANTKLGYTPTVPSKFGQVGDYDDADAAGLMSGQLQLPGKKDKGEVKLLAAGNESGPSSSAAAPKPKKMKNKKVQLEPEYDPENPESATNQRHMSLFDELRMGAEGGDYELADEEFYHNRESFSQRGRHGLLPDASDEFNPDFDGDFDGDYDNNDHHDEGLGSDSFEDEASEDPQSPPNSSEQTLWHGTIERAVSTTYLGRIKDSKDQLERLNALNDISMSANTGQVSSAEPYARFDFILDRILKTRILRVEELKLNAERAYVSYLGHHMALFLRSSGIEERLKTVKISKTPFKNKEQVAKLAWEFAKGLGLCGPRGDRPPPAISTATAHRLGLGSESTQFLNIGTPTLFSHVVEIERQDTEKRATEQQRNDHRVRRKYWDAKQLAIQQGKPIPHPPRELIEQRERLKKQKEETAIARRERSQQQHEAHRLKLLQARLESGGVEAQMLKSRGGGQDRFGDIHTALPGTLRTATLKTRKTVLIDFSDDESLSPMALKRDRQYQKQLRRDKDAQLAQQTQSQEPQHQHRGRDFDLAMDLSEDQLDAKMSKFFPNNQKAPQHVRGMGYGDHPNDPRYHAAQEEAAVKAAKQAAREQRQQQQQQQRGSTTSKFFEEHEAWVKQQQHKKSMRDRLDVKELEEDIKAQEQYDKAFSKAKERPKKEPAPGRDLLKQSALFSKEPRRIRTGELDHKVHLDIVL